MKTFTFIISFFCILSLNSCESVVKILTSEELSSTDLPNDQATLTDCFSETESNGKEIKPKQSVYQKYRNIQKLSDGKMIQSSLAGLFIHAYNRFQSGVSPANELERKIFQKFEALPGEINQSFACSVNGFNGLSEEVQKEFVPAQFLTAQSLTTQQVQALFTEEVMARASESLFGNIECLEDETPGLKRDVSDLQGSDDVGFSPFKPIIYKINDLRTAYHLPKFQPQTLRNEELEMKCELLQQGETLTQDCSLQTENCTGNSISASGTRICLAVPIIAPGESVVLEGANFFSSDGMVELRSKQNPDFTRRVQAHVCGDMSISDENIVEGVADKILFSVPESFSSGVYSVKVVMPHESKSNDFHVSESIFIEISSNPQTKYSISTERLIANNETNPERLGSDEVGIKIITASFNSDLSLASQNNFPLIEFGDVDTGEDRDMKNVLYNSNNFAVALGIVGYEIDSRKAFREEIDSFSEAFIDIVSDLKEVLLGFSSIPIYEIIKSNGANPTFWIATAITVAVVAAIVTSIAIWMPADLIIEDNIVLNTYDIGKLTSLNSQAYPENYTSPGGIKVKVNPEEKTVNQYREDRSYSSDDSKYTIEFRYNKID